MPTNMPVALDTFVNPAAGDTTSAVPHHTQHSTANDALAVIERIVVGPTYVNLKGFGAVGNGSTNDSAAVTAALAATPSGAILRVPAGEYMVDPGILQLLAKYHLWGDGADTSWFTLRSDTSNPALLIDVNVGGGVRTNYGTRIKGIGINLVNAPNATGIRVGDVGGTGVHSNWTHLDDVRVEGGKISFDCQAANVKVTNFHFIDPSVSFIKAPSTGLELRVRDGVCDMTPSHTVAKAFDFSVPSSGNWGAVYMRDVELNNAGTVTRCIVVECLSGSASVPVRCFNITLDNLSGPGYEFINVTDCQVIGGWVNAANGSGNGAVRFYGGGAHTLMGIEQLNGGSGGCSFDFAGNTPSGITLIGNNPATGPYYKISATGKPNGLLILDRIAGAAVLGNITNDWPGLKAAMANLWTPPFIMSDLVYGTDTTAPVTGRATLVAGSVTVSCTAVDSTVSDFELTRRILGGTAGHLYISNVTTGVGFTISSTSNTDTSTITWVHHR